MEKQYFLREPVEHIDFTSFDSTPIIDSMQRMSFTAGELARAAEIFDIMLQDDNATIMLALAGSTSAAGCMNLYSDLVKYNMVDVVVATGASLIDMDFFEALGFKHYIGNPLVNDSVLHSLSIDRIYDTFIDEEQLKMCDNTIKEIANSLPPRVYSSREFLKEAGRWLKSNSKKKNSLLEIAYEYNVPIFCPAFSDSSAGFGLVMHQIAKPNAHISIDSVKDFRELTLIKIRANDSGVLIIGGGVPKNFVLDTVVCAEVLGYQVPMHKYAIQITIADVRDGALSSSTLREAESWGKLQTTNEQMVFAEVTSVMPLLASYAYHKGNWRNRKRREWAKIF